MPPTGHRALRVLMVSWEYPPAVIGGLGRHVEGLASALATAGHEITVLTRAVPGAPEREQTGPVRLLRVPAGRPPPSASAEALRRWAAELSATLTAGALG